MVAAMAGCRKQKPSQSAVSLNAAEAAEVRWGLSLLIDRDYIARQIARGGQEPASSFVPSAMPDADGSPFYQNVGVGNHSGYYETHPDAYGENYAKGIEILRKYYAYDEKTGRFSGFPTVTYLYNNSDTHRAVGEYLQNLYASVGITVQLENQEWNTFLSTRKSGDYALARNGWVADYHDPISFLDMWTGNSGNNDVGFGKGAHQNVKAYSLDLTPFGRDVKVENGTWGETYDVLISAIKEEKNENNRYGMMHLAETMLMETGCIVPLYYYADTYMCSRSVTGLYANATGCKFFGETLVNGSGSGISVCIASEPESLDPALSTTVDGTTLLSHLFSGLARWGKDNSGNVGIYPDCAQTLPEGVLNDDGTVTYTYRLRENLLWSDGKPLTAEDFRYAWNRAADPKTASSYGYLFDGVKSVEAPDAATLVVTLKKPLSYWNELLTMPAFFPVRQDVVAGNDAWAADAKDYVSNGAYRMTGWTHDSVITLEKNPQYQDASRITMEKIHFYLSDDANNMLSNFKNGTWLLIDDVPTNEAENLKKQYPEEFITAPQLGTYYICWSIDFDLSPKS